MMKPLEERTYDRRSCIVFCKTNDRFGGLSNMAAGYPLCINGVRIPTSEALYQACRFPLMPEIQRIIIEQRSPMTAKMKSKAYLRWCREDWDNVRVSVMRWCLRVKLSQNWDSFSALLISTGKRPIVEESRRDAFWGAKPVSEHMLVGTNVLGRLLMEVRRDCLTSGKSRLHVVEPLAIQNFLLYGRPIEMAHAEHEGIRRPASEAGGATSEADAPVGRFRRWIDQLIQDSLTSLARPVPDGL